MVVEMVRAIPTMETARRIKMATVQKGTEAMRHATQAGVPWWYDNTGFDCVRSISFRDDGHTTRLTLADTSYVLHFCDYHGWKT